MKPEAEKHARALAAEEKLRAEIKRFETMAPEHVDELLHGHGLDPQQTVETIKRLVHDKLEEIRRREGVHFAQAIAVTATAMAVAVATRALLAGPSRRPPCGRFRHSRCLFARVARRSHGVFTPAAADCACAERRNHPDA